MVDTATRQAAAKLRERANSDLTLRYDVRSELRALAESMDPTPRITVSSGDRKLIINYQNKEVPAALEEALRNAGAVSSIHAKLIDQLYEAVRDRD